MPPKPSFPVFQSETAPCWQLLVASSRVGGLLASRVWCGGALMSFLQRLGGQLSKWQRAGTKRDTKYRVSVDGFCRRHERNVATEAFQQFPIMSLS